MGEMLLNGRLYGASGIRELTQAQYDALPASKLTDGVLYCIKDDGIVEGDKYAPIIYSLEEREIGVWCDGKPLYQKTVHVGALTPVDNIVAHNISNIECIVDVWGYSSQGVRWFPLPYVQTSNLIGYQTKIYADETNVYCTILNDDYITDSYVTIQYTKTTDVPGSGAWGTDGVPMMHYDGTERVVGTWFGETLYEKTIHKTNVSPSSTDTVLVSASEISPDLDSVHRISGMFGRMQVNSSPYGTDGYNVVWGASSTYYHYNWYNENAPHVYLTYQYTKTTS